MNDGPDDNDIIDQAYAMTRGPYPAGATLEHRGALWMIGELLRIHEQEVDQINNLLEAKKS